jgi:PPE-repeat protein
MPAAAAAWQSLADELTLAAAGYGSVVSSVVGGPTGPSSTSMAAAAAPYVAWLSATGDQAQQPAVQVAAAASAVGLASGTGALGSTGIGGFGTGAPAISAGMGQATRAGALSVPSAWTGAAPPVTTAGTAMHIGGAPGISAALAGAQSAMPPMMPVANMGGRQGAATPTRFELRSTVIPFTPAAG